VKGRGDARKLKKTLDLRIWTSILGPFAVSFAPEKEHLDPLFGGFLNGAVPAKLRVRSLVWTISGAISIIKILKFEFEPHFVMPRRCIFPERFISLKCA
jgi:hypothetical protein